MSAFRLAVLPLLLAATVTAAEKSNGLPKTSPFVSASTPAGAADISAETIEFAGVSIIGQKTDLIFHDKRSKKNHWIAKGETKEGISVVSYDDVREQVQVKINGVEKTLPLRKNAKAGSGPRPVSPVQLGFNVPTPAATNATGAVDLATVTGGAAGAAAANAQPAAANPPPPAPTTPESITRQETEARMLVSDLLEIGMAQRKAYEEAQRKAAQGDSSTPATPTAPSPIAPDASK
jgi:hypothetical protein